MNIGGILLRPLYWLAGKIFAIWARPAIQPEAPAELLGDPDAAVCYVLETGGLAERVIQVLRHAGSSPCRRHAAHRGLLF